MRELRVFILVLVASTIPSGGGVVSANRPALVGGSLSQASELASNGEQAYRARLRARIAGSGTFLAHVLAQSDSLLVRWPAGERSLTVHVSAPRFRPERTHEVIRALERWQAIPGFPVRFRLVADPDHAAIHVTWVSRLPWYRTGQTDVRWGPGGWLEAAVVYVSEHDRQGKPLSGQALYTVALHEIGHALGLGHSEDERDVMYPIAGIHDLTSRDAETAELLYAVMPGSLREPTQR